MPLPILAEALPLLAEALPGIVGAAGGGGAAVAEGAGAVTGAATAAEGAGAATAEGGGSGIADVLSSLQGSGGGGGGKGSGIGDIFESAASASSIGIALDAAGKFGTAALAAGSAAVESVEATKRERIQQKNATTRTDIQGRTDFYADTFQQLEDYRNVFGGQYESTHDYTIGI